MRSEFLNHVTRVVVKIGTKLLVNAGGRLDPERFEHIAEELTWLQMNGKQPVLVSSGAIVAGLETLGMKERPADLPMLQAAAAIGQSQLMHHYQLAFSKRKIKIAQILLTAEDLKERRRHLNAKNTFEALLEQNVIPIVNENDTVAVDEIKFGDNDQLSALVSNLVSADLLTLLTDQKGFLKDGQVMHTVFEIDKDLENHAHNSKDWKGVGGMQAKLNAARILMRSGEYMLIADGRQKGIFQMIFQGEEVGTLFVPRGKKLSGKKKWIAHFIHPQGTLILDQGAVAAIRDRAKSLLLPGVQAVKGAFDSGDVVHVCDSEENEIARGIVNYGADELKKILKQARAQEKTKKQSLSEVVHRDNLVVL
jgi:glutamate 5-kinase